MTKCVICSETTPDGDVAMIDGLPFCQEHEWGGMGVASRIYQILNETVAAPDDELAVRRIVTALVAANADANASLELCKENFTNYAEDMEVELEEQLVQRAFHSQRADDCEKELTEERAFSKRLQLELTALQTPHHTGRVYTNV